MGEAAYKRQLQRVRDRRDPQTVEPSTANEELDEAYLDNISFDRFLVEHLGDGPTDPTSA